MKLLVVGFSLLPFLFGWLINLAVMKIEFYPVFIISGVALLLLWAGIAYLTRPYCKSNKETILLLNTVAAVVLILLGIQDLILNAYLPNGIGIWTQFYYLPLLRAVSIFSKFFTSSVFVMYCIEFVLLITASTLGCKTRKCD